MLTRPRRCWRRRASRAASLRAIGRIAVAHLVELGPRRLEEVDVVQVGLDAGDARRGRAGRARRRRSAVSARRPGLGSAPATRSGSAIRTRLIRRAMSAPRNTRCTWWRSDRAPSASPACSSTRAAASAARSAPLGERLDEVARAAVSPRVAVAVGAHEPGREVAVEGPLEGRVVAGLLDHRRAQRGVQLGAAGEIDLGGRAGGVDDLRQRHVDTRRLQGAAELRPCGRRACRAPRPVVMSPIAGRYRRAGHPTRHEPRCRVAAWGTHAAREGNRCPSTRPCSGRWTTTRRVA